MATRWDASRDYDSQTFSEDYNLHGASDRSHDHPSVTRDDDFFGALNLQDQDGDDQDYGSLEDADLDLIADIVDGKAPHQSTPRRRPLRAAAHQTDDNSVTSLLRYVLDGSQEDTDYQGPAAFDPTRPPSRTRPDQLVPLADDADEDHFGDWSGSTPKRQTRSANDTQGLAEDSTPDAVNSSVLGIHCEICEAYTDSLNRRSGIPAPTLTVSTTMTAAAGKDKDLTDRKGAQDKNTHVKDIPKPIVRSAMKPPNNSQGKALPTKGKLVRHIQLPTELFDESDQEDASRIKNHGQQSGQKEEKDRIEKTHPAVPEVPVATEIISAPVIPGPSRFTRVSKKNVSPAKKPLPTIPTPQDDDVNEAKNDNLDAKEEQEQVSKTVQELKRLLRTLRLPLTETLEASLDALDATTLRTGGLCEMMSLLLQLGGMYEKKEEVIHQMTDQIIAHQEQPRADPTADKKMQELNQELEIVKHELAISRQECHALETKSDGLVAELERVNRTKDEEAQQYHPDSEKRRFLDAASQVSGTWGSVQELLSEKKDQSNSPIPSTKEIQQSREAMSTDWQGHVLRIEHELKALKAVLSSSPTTGLSITPMKVMELEDRLEAALLDNQRLQIKNRKLTKELLRLHEATADEHGDDNIKYKPLVLAVMAGLGVQSHRNILPVLEEIERILQDVPRLRRFIANTEKIVWESEILEGIVKVRGPRGIDKDRDVDGNTGTHIAFGRTCSMGFEETLQRLKEWSELLDVLNHVEFEEDIEDTATLVQS
ncbi:hypothetical protein EC968_008118 [Mortierella alpina]|nr:hypothetical protein EC968_008118 [Mortierella alpina]